MFFRTPRPKFPRRGVTLVEMLVTVALLVLMMTVIVQVFQAATGAVSASRAYQDLDSGFRQLDATIRQDLGNITARMTPPLDPKNNLGYFEYIENSFADVQGEDSDDCLRFTVKAPEGQLFTGRFFPNKWIASLTSNPGSGNLTTAQYSYLESVTPITIQSQYAEIIYFLRNGNLYRRVLLVAPDRQGVIAQGSANASNTAYTAGVFSPSPPPATQMTVSWLGVNDFSAHPNPSNPAPAGQTYTEANIILNTLGDLTNRENRYAAPRFANDFINLDGVPDDNNGDSVPDFWPSLYYNLASIQDSSPGSGLIQEIPGANRTSAGSGRATFATIAFPYVYPFAYSKPDPSGLNGLGWIHTPDPGNSANTVASLLLLNHNPLDVGDSLSGPSLPQTWWGFPTWRETMSPNWVDPFLYPALNPSQATGLNPFAASGAAASNGTELLPPMTTALVGSVSGSTTGVTASYRTFNQLFNDGAGSDTFAAHPTWSPVDGLWKQCWEDDLVMTGVRSFDVKAYDNAFPGYVDLGWGDDGRNLLPYNTAATVTSPTPAAWTPPLLGSTGASSATGYGGASFTGTPFIWPPVVNTSSGTAISSGAIYNAFTLYSATLAHEGRIPPLVWDNRPDYQAPTYNPNIGDDTSSVVRLRRVWDTWSTDYSNAPSSGVNPASGFPYGLPFGPPIYPSYPPPYPAALRGIQIQIRATDPRNEKVKVLTIRQDFSDKL